MILKLCNLEVFFFQYNVSTGLELPGFLPGGNFLLPWDISVKTEQEKWPSVNETYAGGKKRMPRKNVKGKFSTKLSNSVVVLYDINMTTT